MYLCVLTSLLGVGYCTYRSRVAMYIPLCTYVTARSRYIHMYMYMYDRIVKEPVVILVWWL